MKRIPDTILYTAVLLLAAYVVGSGGCSSFIETVYYPTVSGGRWVWERPTTQALR